MNRRRFLVSSGGATAVALGGPWLSAASAATEDELAFANFGVSAEFLLKDFYARALNAKVKKVKVFGRSQAAVLRSGQSAAAQHAKALAALLETAGETVPVEADFAFVWPKNAFSGASAAVRTGLTALRPVLASYQTAAASVSEADYRVLYASLAASLGQQIGALAALSRPVGAQAFPVAVDLETASAAIEAYLG